VRTDGPTGEPLACALCAAAETVAPWPEPPPPRAAHTGKTSVPATMLAASARLRSAQRFPRRHNFGGRATIGVMALAGGNCFETWATVELR